MPAWNLRCPEGHASVEIGRNRFWCRTCERAGRNGSYPMTELVDLASRGSA